MHMSFLSSWRYKGSISILVIIFSLMTVNNIDADGHFFSECEKGGGRVERKGGRVGGRVVCRPPKSVPAPAKIDQEKEDKAYTLIAIQAVFAEEIKKYGSGLTAYLTDPSGVIYLTVLSIMPDLRAQNKAANAKDLEMRLNSIKHLFFELADFQKWITDFAPPKITSFSPSEGIPKDEITIKGENLDTVTEVKFADAKAQFTVISNNELKVVVPDYIGYTSLWIKVITKFGSAIPSNDFTNLGTCSDKQIPLAMYELNLRLPRGNEIKGECNPAEIGNYKSYTELVKMMGARYGFVKREPPQINHISRKSGLPGETLQIYGKNLYQIKGVYFGDTPAKKYDQDPLHLTAVIPASGGHVSVVTYSGVDVWPGTFEVLSPPVIETLNKSEAVKGDTLTIKGKNFGTEPSVFFGTLRAPSLTANSPTEIYVQLVDAMKDAEVFVETAGGKAVAATKIRVWSGECRDPLIIKAFRELMTTKPAGQGDEGQCDPSKYNNGQWKNYADLKFRVQQRYGYVSQPAPTITRIFPTNGMVGSWVTIHGNNLDNLQGVIFGSNAAEEVESKSANEIRAKIRFGSESGDIVVSTLHGVARYANFGITYPPAINNVNPTTALPGIEVTLRGVSLGEVDNVTVGGVNATFVVHSQTEIAIKIPKGPTGFVEIRARSPKGSSTWSSFGVVTARLSIPDKQLRKVRLEIIGPDGKLNGSAPLIGNAGAGFNGAVLDQLIGNSGVSLTANTGGALTGNVPLTSNVPLSVNDISSLIGNAGASLIGNAGASLIGNAGASLTSNVPLIDISSSGLQFSLGKLIGNAGAGLNNGQVTNLIGNAGASLIGNAGAGLAGNAGSSLIGNAGAGLVDGSLSLITNKPANLLVLDIKNLLAGNAGSSLKLPIAIVNIAPPKIDLSVGVSVGLRRHVQGLKDTPSVDKYKIKPSDKTSVDRFETEPLVPPVQKYVLPSPESTKVEPHKPTLKPTLEPTGMPSAPTPVIMPKIVTPLPSVEVIKPSPTPTPTPAPTEKPVCSSGSTYSFTFSTCMEDAPQKLSPYDGLPCPDNVNSIPSYATKGCIAQ